MTNLNRQFPVMYIEVKEYEALKKAYDAACKFLAVNIADPDITSEMCKYYREWKQASLDTPTIVAVSKTGDIVVADRRVKTLCAS